MNQTYTTMATTSTHTSHTHTPSEVSIKNLFLLIVGCIALCGGAALIGSLAVTETMGAWFTNLAKPEIHPPAGLYTPVWLGLYMMMAVSLFYMVRDHHPKKTLMLVLFVVQLLLNVTWNVLFFKFHLLGVSVLFILLLTGVMVIFYRIVQPIRPISAYLFIPYIAWAAFTAFYTFGIWRLN